MIILDTNVLSELMRRQPAPAVLRWLDLQPSQSVWITAIALSESRLGPAPLLPGQRRDNLAQAFDQLLTTDLENRVLPFDAEAAAPCCVSCSVSRASATCSSPTTPRWWSTSPTKWR